MEKFLKHLKQRREGAVLLWLDFLLLRTLLQTKRRAMKSVKIALPIWIHFKKSLKRKTHQLQKKYGSKAAEYKGVLQNSQVKPK